MNEMAPVSDEDHDDEDNIHFHALYTASQCRVYCSNANAASTRLALNTLVV